MTTVYTNTLNGITFENDTTATPVIGTWTGGLSFDLTATFSGSPVIQGREVTIHFCVTDSNLGTQPIADLEETGYTIIRLNPYITNYTVSGSLNGQSGTYLYVWLSHDVFGLDATTTASVAISADVVSSGGGSVAGQDGSTLVWTNTTTSQPYKLQCINDPPQVAWTSLS